MDTMRKVNKENSLLLAKSITKTKSLLVYYVIQIILDSQTCSNRTSVYIKKSGCKK